MNPTAMENWLQSGAISEVGGNRTFDPGSPEALWLVVQGQVDLFMIELLPAPAIDGGDREGKRFHLLTVEAGQVLCGLPGNLSGYKLLATGIPGTQVCRLKRRDLPGLAADEVDGWLANWLRGFTQALVRERIPNSYTPIPDGSDVAAAEAAIYSIYQGLIWVKVEEGVCYWLSGRKTPISPQTVVPVTDSSWLEAEAGCRFSAVKKPAIFGEGQLWDGIDQWHRWLLEHFAVRLEEITRTEQEQLNRKIIESEHFMRKSLLNLAAVTQVQKKAELDDSPDPLFMACRAVGLANGMEVAPVPAGLKQNFSDPLEDIARVSRFRTRQVVLKGKWWCKDNGPLLGFLAEDDSPVALLPVKNRNYELYNPAKQTSQRVDEKLAQEISPLAHTFYRPLPSHKLKVWDIARYSLKSRVLRDFTIMILMGAGVGLLNLAIPLGTGRLIDVVIPEAEHSQLWQLTFILLVSMVAIMMFDLTRSLAMLRFEGRLNADLEAAVWDRLLNLPTPFFRQFSVGDLAMRANSINSIRQILSGVTVDAVLSGVFSFFNLFVLFAYDLKLAMIAIAVVVIQIAMILLSAWLELRLQRRLMDKEGKLAGLILELIKGISKFNVAGAETRAFYQWARSFSELRAIGFRASMVFSYLDMFNTAFPLLITAFIFTQVGVPHAGGLSVGGFLAFYSAFSSFVGAMTGTVGALVSSLNVIPLYERAKPILETEPEINDLKAHPGELTGEIEVGHVSFRYADDGPDILNDVSVRIRPGEFVAVVGPSGSGKSTLLRLLLGFEKPWAGAVFYDGQDLAQLDLRSVRSHLGVVLQNSQLMSGDILTNIIGSKKLTVKDAEEAARMSGLDEDLKQMPMGLYSVVSEGGSTLSGGQRQRLLIARAVVSKPRIIFFDEATSALDNRTQAIVSRSLESLKATRVVIAHRLSTIINADRIIVMDKGTVVETGTYQELLAREGLFADLAKRQLA